MSLTEALHVAAVRITRPQLKAAGPPGRSLLRAGGGVTGMNIA